mmetsp:Transcript_33141/g.70638  ORF Transcript_33141/g.70638 Transcript_33141/m.70638 type:complete len:156 (-) Transcript_33141:279-746(-)
MGLTFTDTPWEMNGLIALGKATTSFAVILAALQFDSRSLMWMTYPTAALLCLCMSRLWAVVKVEVGVSWRVATGVSLGGWAFAMAVLVCCLVISKHVGPDEYVLAVLFILCPEAMLCLASKECHPADDDGDRDGDGDNDGTELEEKATKQKYGAV